MSIDPWFAERISLHAEGKIRYLPHLFSVVDVAATISEPQNGSATSEMVDVKCFCVCNPPTKATMSMTVETARKLLVDLQKLLR